jgi:hypothetical protein
MPLNEQILRACKDLIDDAKTGCTDLVFKEISLEILSKAHNVLTERQFKELAAYTAGKMKEKAQFEFPEQELAMPE